MKSFSCKIFPTALTLWETLVSGGIRCSITVVVIKMEGPVSAALHDKGYVSMCLTYTLFHPLALKKAQ